MRPEAPNRNGMSQFAEPGLPGHAPCAARGARISRMTELRVACRCDARRKSGAFACPMNARHRDFLARHRRRFAANPGMAQMYRTRDRLVEKQKAAARWRAEDFPARIDKQGAGR